MATHEDITEREELNARLKNQFELGRKQEEALLTRNLQFDTAINNMSQGLCFFDSDHRLIVCNDRFVSMYDIAPERVSPGMSLIEIVDLRFEAGSFPAMTRDEYLRWRTNVAVSNEAKDSVVELMNGRTFKIRHRPMPGGGWVATHEDITEQRQSEVKIEYMAHHDALTDLANRVLLNERRAGGQCVAEVAADGLRKPLEGGPVEGGGRGRDGVHGLHARSRPRPAHPWNAAVSCGSAGARPGGRLGDALCDGAAGGTGRAAQAGMNREHVEGSPDS